MACVVGLTLNISQECCADLISLSTLSNYAADATFVFGIKTDSMVCNTHKKEFFQEKCRRKFCVGKIHERTKLVRKSHQYSVSKYLQNNRDSSLGFFPNSNICKSCSSTSEEIKKRPRSASDENDPLQELNEFFSNCGITPINSDTLEDITTLATKKLIEVVNVGIEKARKCGLELHLDFDENQTAKNDIKSLTVNLKQKYDSSSYREKVQILTLMPESWTASKIVDTFGCTFYQVKLSRSLKRKSGVLTIPPPKSGKKFETALMENLENFLYSEEVTSVCPDMNKFGKVDGEERPIRLLLHTMRDTYSLYKEHFPQKSGIGRVKFFEILHKKFKDVKLADHNGMHNVCVCQKHENLKLATNVLDRERGYYKELMSSIVCNIENETCMLSQCQVCNKKQKIDALKKMIKDKIEEKNIKFPISYSQWVKDPVTNKMTIASKQRELAEYIAEFSNQVYSILSHHFTTKIQNTYFKDMKKNLEFGNCVIQMDFAENYSMVVQNEIMSHHWSNPQATVHPFSITFHNGFNIDTKSMAIISNEMKHNSETVFAFLKTLTDWLKEEFPFIKKIDYFSDGCAGQYKNFKNFLTILDHEKNFGLKSCWNFFATSHGKGACDGIGGTLKRKVRRESLTRTENNHIVTALSMYEYLMTIPEMKTTVIYVSQQQVQDIIQKYNVIHRFSEGSTVKGTLNFHKIEALDDNRMKFSRTSITDKHYVVKSIFEERNNDDKTDQSQEESNDDGAIENNPWRIGEYVAVIYQKIWYLAKIVSIGEDENGYVEVLFASPQGQVYPFQWYQFNDSRDQVWILEDQILCSVSPTHGTTARMAQKLRITEADHANIDRLFSMAKM